MGIGNFFKTIVSAEAMGDEIIRLQRSNYQKVMLQFPAYNLKWTPQSRQMLA